MVLIVFASVLMFSFTRKENNSNSADKIKIGFLVDDLVQERWSKDINYFSKRVEELGGHAEIKNAYNDAHTQINQLKQMVDEGIKVIVVVAVDGKAIANAIDYADKAGVKVIAYDRLIPNCNLHYYVTFNSIKVGELMAEHMVKVKPKGNYSFINGPISDNNTSLIKQGQMNVLKPYIDQGDIKVVFDQAVEMWGPLEAFLLLDGFLKDYTGTLDVTFSASDGLSEGVVQALDAYPMFQNTLVSGQDASVAACRNIMLGHHQSMSVYKSIKAIANKAAELAMKLMTTGDVEMQTYANNGKRNVPCILFDVEAVDKTNIKEIVTRDGYIKEFELYETK